MSTPQDGMPPVYHGVWQRTLYAGAGDEGRHIEDRTTRVIWLQTAHWHADLRVPADRPDFVGVMSLEECNREQLVWLASQTAFVGLTRIEGHFCTWHRLLDLRPGLDLFSAEYPGERRLAARTESAGAEEADEGGGEAIYEDEMVQE